jgi:hypothetical protein
VKNTHRIAAFAVAISLLAACATGGGPRPGQTPEQYLETRAEARWAHVLGGQWAEAYAFLTPGYREVHDLQGYRDAMQNRRLQWTAAEVQGVDCDSDERCSVQVRVNYSVIGGIPGVREMSSVHNVSETWLRLGGEWYMLPRTDGR